MGQEGVEGFYPADRGKLGRGRARARPIDPSEVKGPNEWTVAKQVQRSSKWSLVVGLEGVTRGADGGGSLIFGFFFLLEIKGEEKEDQTDGMVGEPMAEALEPAVLVVIFFGCDPDAVVADDPVKLFFYEGGEFVIAYVHIQFHTGVGAYPVYVV